MLQSVFMLKEPVLLNPHTCDFPDANLAMCEPDGLLAVGGDLSPQRLIAAYSKGIFPWYSEGQPLLWWSPDPRTVLYPHKLRISKSLKKCLRQKRFEITHNRAFAEVIKSCAVAPRQFQDGTWITAEMQAAYCRLHASGVAQSVEVWRDGELVGGLYGIAIGGAFFGESMFHRCSNASKVALVALVERLLERGVGIIDCQQNTEHLMSLGAQEISRAEFLQQIAALV